MPLGNRGIVGWEPIAEIVLPRGKLGRIIDILLANSINSCLLVLTKYGKFDIAAELLTWARVLMT